jgi:hypothetical protein
MSPCLHRMARTRALSSYSLRPRRGEAAGGVQLQGPGLGKRNDAEAARRRVWNKEQPEELGGDLAPVTPKLPLAKEGS